MTDSVRDSQRAAAATISQLKSSSWLPRLLYRAGAVRANLLTVALRRFGFVAALAVAAIGLSGSGCDVNLTGDVANQTGTASQRLLQTSADWQKNLASLEGQLASDGNGVATNALYRVQNLAQATVASAAGNLQCTVDFLNVRISTALVDLKNHVLHPGTKPPVRPPALCSAVPNAVDVSHVQDGSLTQLSLYGHDLTPTNLQFATLSSTGQVTTVAGADVSNPSRYEATVNLSRTNGLKIGSDAQKLLVQSTVKGQIQTIASLNVIQPPPPLQPKPITVNDPKMIFQKLSDLIVCAWSVRHLAASRALRFM
jgi:hypothetical protein